MLHNSVLPDSTLAVRIFLAELGVAQINLPPKKTPVFAPADSVSVA
jgi:hypothetical protein